MAVSKKPDGFMNTVTNFFKRVKNQDTIKISDNQIQTFNRPANQEELDKRRDLQVFRQFLQSKNWNIKHIELFDEYRRMDQTFPIINAALRIYGQEVCLTGDTVIPTPMGDMTIRELFDKKKTEFYVRSFNSKFNSWEWNVSKYVKNNGIKPVFKVTVNRNINSSTADIDKRTEASFKCTEDHKIMVGPNVFKPLSELKVGDEIWSMFLEIDPECKCKRPVYNSTVIESIESAGEEEVFDLVDVAPNHHFIIKLTDTFFVAVHNCTKDTEGNVIKIISDNKKVRKLLEDLFFKNLKINSSSYLHVRSMLKFGNHWAFLDTRPGVGVVDLIHLPPEAIRIMLMNDAMRLDDFKYQWWGQGGGVQFEPWEVVHWKNIEDLETEPYGQSILRSVVDTYRRIILMREAMIVYRITRAPQRLLFKIDTSGYGPDESIRIADELKKQMYKKPLVNPNTGEMDYKYNPISIEENLYMTTAEGDTSDVRVLEGASNLDAVEDYKIIKDDLFAGLLIPKSYLTFEEDLCKSLETNVLTLNGTKNFGELTEDFQKGIANYVYAADENGDIKPGKVTWAGKTRSVHSYYKVTLDNGEVVESTNNHPWMLRNGKYVRTDELNIGDSLMPLYTRISTLAKDGGTDKLGGYEMVWHNGRSKWEYTHRMVALNMNPDGYKQDGDGRMVVHHVDGNKLNNHPDNLQFISQKEHIKEHADIAYRNLCSPESRKKLYDIQQTDEYKTKLSNSLKKDFETNDAKRQAIAETNVKYNKAKIAQTAYLEKLASSELSQAGENNGNFRGFLSKEELTNLLDNKTFRSFYDIQNYINKEYPNMIQYFRKIDLLNILDMDEKTFDEKYIKYFLLEIDEELVLELIKEGFSNSEIYQTTTIARSSFDNHYKKKYGFRTFSEYRKSLKLTAPYNHKVVSVELIVEDKDMYDITVEHYHNFALAAGVFVHNCIRGNTKLRTNEGVISIEELTSIFDQEPDKKIFSMSSNKYGVYLSGKILWAGKTKEVTSLYRISINDKHIVEVTRNHPFLMESLKYKRAEYLEVGDKIRNMYDDEYIVTDVSVVELEAPEFVYDIEVEEYHNFALESGVFVHNSNKAALAQEDLRFAGAIRQYQAHYIEGLLQIAIVHLHMNGCSTEELSSFKIQMNTNSTLAEKTRTELLEQRFNLAGLAWDKNQTGLNFMSFTQVLKDILHFTDEDIKKTFEDQMLEKKISWRMKKLEEDGFYTEPEQGKEKVVGMELDNDVFGNMLFEHKELIKHNVKSIITQKVDEEIAFLTRRAEAEPTPKMIENIIKDENVFENRWMRTLKEVKRDIE